MRDNVKQIGKNYMYNTMYNILSIIIPFITTPYISRVLGPERIGKYTFTYSIAYYFTLFTLLGLNKYGNRTIAFAKNDLRKRDKLFCEIYTLQLFTGIISTIVYIFVVMFISSNYKQLAIIQILFVISATFDVSWFFFGIENFRMPMIRNMIIRLANVALLFIFVRSESDVIAYTVIMAGSSLASQLTFLGPLTKIVRFQRPIRSNVVSHIKPNFLLFIPSIAVSVYKVMDKIMLGVMIDNLQVGLYEYSEKIINMPLILVSTISTVMLPRMSSIVANKDVETEKKYIDFTLTFVICVSCGVFFGIMGILDIFVPWFLGNQFLESVKIATILAPTGILIAWGGVMSSQILLPHENDGKYVQCVCTGAIVNLLLNISLIPRFFGVGAAIATLFTEIVVMSMQTFFASKYFHFKKHLLVLLLFSLIGFVMMETIKHVIPTFNNVFLCIITKIIFGGAMYFIISMISMKIVNRPLYNNLVAIITNRSFTN